jgi:transposase
LSRIQGSRDATMLVGLAGLAAGVCELVDGEWWLWVETVADVVGCPGCGSRAVGHGRSRTLVRDLPMAGRRTVLVWSKLRWRCPEVEARGAPGRRPPPRSALGRC